MITFIVGGGIVDMEFTKGFIKRFDESSLYVIACDKGYEICENLNLVPDIVIGDFDSSSAGTLERAQSSMTEVIKLNPVKDDTDIEAALRFAFGKTKGDIYILGGTGGRIDHTLGNIALLGLSMKNNRKAYLIDSHNKIQMISKGKTVTISKAEAFGKYVSVFPYMGEVSGLSMIGFKYSVDKVVLSGFNTLTVSNEVVDKYGSISIDEGNLIICESRD